MEEKKGKSKIYLLWGTIFAVISLIVGPILNNLMSNPGTISEFDFSFNGLVNSFLSGFLLPKSLMFSGGIFLTLCLLPLFMKTNKSYSSTPNAILGKDYDTSSDKKGAARWLSSAEIAKVFPRYSFAEAGKYKVNGFVVQTIETKNATYANLKGDVHCLIIGTTGSGKTIRFVIPTMQFLARTASRPSVIVTDPKGELYQTQSKLYQERGYDIITINLREPLKRSNCWNPCNIAYKEYHEGLKQKEKIKFHYDKVIDYQKSLKLVGKKDEYYEEWYEYNDYAFVNLKDAVLEAERNENSMKSKAMESINDLVTTIYAESAKKAQDPFWVKSASNLVEGLLIALLEDSEIEELGITSQKFNLGTVSSTLSLRVDQLKSYFAIRDISSYAKRKAQGSINAPQSGTQESIISTAMADLTPFSDPDIQYITCNNDINFKDIGVKPMAVFLIIPDEKENRHVFASLFITQAYKSLVELATEYGGKTPHPVNFLIDEFANLPVIPGMENKITVARSRGMAFMLIIQSLSQLRAKYGADVSEIIRTNCNMQVFLATNDNETAEYFSKICGEKTIKEVSSSQDGQTGKQNLSYSLSGRPLIKPEELLTMPEGVSIVKALRMQPAKLKQMAYWKSRSYYKGEQVINAPWNPNLFVFEQDGFFDIVYRNRNDAEFLKDQLQEYDLDLIKEERQRDLENFNSGGDGLSGFGGDEGGSGFGEHRDNDDKEYSQDIEPLNTDLGSEIIDMFKYEEPKGSKEFGEIMDIFHEGFDLDADININDIRDNESKIKEIENQNEISKKNIDDIMNIKVPKKTNNVS